MEYLRYWRLAMAWSLPRTVKLSGKDVGPSIYAAVAAVVSICVFFALDQDGSEFTNAVTALCVGVVSGGGTWLLLFFLLTVFAAPYAISRDMMARLDAKAENDRERNAIAEDIRFFTEMHKEVSSQDIFDLSAWMPKMADWMTRLRDRAVDEADRQRIEAEQYIRSIEKPAANPSKQQFLAAISVIIKTHTEKMRQLSGMGSVANSL